MRQEVPTLERPKGEPLFYLQKKNKESTDGLPICSLVDNETPNITFCYLPTTRKLMLWITLEALSPKG